MLYRSPRCWPLTFLCLLPLVLAGCRGAGDGSGEEATAALGTADSAALELYLKQALAVEIPTEPIGTNQVPPGVFYDVPALPTTVGTETSRTSDTSTTNLQVAGVDEADRVKVGRDHLYIALPQQTFRGWDPRFVLTPIETLGAPNTRPVVITGAPVPGVAMLERWPERDLPEPEPARIRVLRLDEAGASAHEVTKIELSELGTTIQGLYFLEGTAKEPTDLLIVITSGSPYGLVPADFAAPYHWENGKTTVHWFDVSDPSRPTEIDRLAFMGRLADSRRIGDQLYVVSRHRATLPIDPWPTTREAADENARVLASARLDDLLPMLRMDDDERRLVHPRDCSILDQKGVLPPSAALTTVSQIDLRDRPRQRSACLAGTIDTLYSSPSALYLTSLHWGSWHGIALHKFALLEAGAEYRGSGRVPGQLWSQGTGASFQIGEHEDVVGVITTLYPGHPDFAGPPEHQYEHRLTLLREADGGRRALEEVSRLPNPREPEPIGKPDEVLHGVRFMDDRVYVVTFRRIDPLYILDVSDAKNPRIAGQVEIPGFSDYLHPVGRDLLIGIGQETTFDARNNWLQGVKVELFDVSDPTTLESIDTAIIGKRGSDTAARRDHHAFTFLAGPAGGFDRFAIPVRRHDILPENGDPDSPAQYYAWRDTGLHLFELLHGAQPSIEPVGVVVAKSLARGDTQGWTSTHRSVIQGDAVHYIHGQEVWSAPWDDPEAADGPN